MKPQVLKSLFRAVGVAMGSVGLLALWAAIDNLGHTAATIGRGDDFWWWQGAASLVFGALSVILLRPAVRVWLRWSGSAARDMINSLVFLVFLSAVFLLLALGLRGWIAVSSLLLVAALAIVLFREASAWFCRRAFSQPAEEQHSSGGASHL